MTDVAGRGGGTDVEYQEKEQWSSKVVQLEKSDLATTLPLSPDNPHIIRLIKHQQSYLRNDKVGTFPKTVNNTIFLLLMTVFT